MQIVNVRDVDIKIKGGGNLVRAFEATRYSDMFQGDVKKYLEKIANKLESQNEIIKRYEASIEALYKETILAKRKAGNRC